MIFQNRRISGAALVLAALVFVVMTLSACTNYGADDFAAGVACGARENRCIAECEKQYEIAQNALDFTNCTDRCRENTGNVCTPGD
ncbi:MAG: hypothetical protein AAFY22_07355 [Pseudomonadota bacterium]